MLARYPVMWNGLDGLFGVDFLSRTGCPLLPYLYICRVRVKSWRHKLALCDSICSIDATKIPDTTSVKCHEDLESWKPQSQFSDTSI